MMKWEQKLQDWLRKNILWFGYAAILLLGIFLRYSYLPNLAADLEFMNSSWYDAIRQGGMAAVLAPELQYTYSPLHLYLWTLTAKLLPMLDTHTALKLVTLVFEALSVGATMLLLRTVLPQKRQKMGCFLGFALLWLNPILLWNAAAWGQTDVFYALFSLLAVLLLIREKPEWALVALGVSLAWKLQAIFLLPVFGIAYFCGKKKFSLLWFLVVPGILVLSGIPMILIGESPLYAVNIYLYQTEMYAKITFNCPNLYALMGDATQVKQAALGLFSRTGLVLCIASLGLMAVWLIRRRTLLQGRFVVLLGAWCVLCCVFFLPRMHERYALVGELLLLCWDLCEHRPRAYLYVACGTLVTLSAYAEYMYRHAFFPLQIGGFINLAILLAVTWEVFHAVSACDALNGTAALQPAGGSQVHE